MPVDLRRAEPEVGTAHSLEPPRRLILTTRRVLLVTYGSHGDLHPYLAMGRALRDGGHRATIATHPQYEPQVRRLGLDFLALPPGPDEVPMDETWARRSNHPVTGLQYVIKDVVLPHFDEAARRLTEAAPEHDLVITHFLTLFAPAVAEACKVPWASCAYSPTVMFSAHDPPALGVMPFLPKLRGLGPRAMRALFTLLEVPSRNWFGAVHDQRRRLGLEPFRDNVLFRYHSPLGTIALFPEWFGAPQPDWPAHTEQVGFPLFHDESSSLSPGLREFLDGGEAPVVFTLGTAVSPMSTGFYDVARAVIRRSRRRAVMVLGPNPPAAELAHRSDAQIFYARYEPFTKLFAEARAIVHPGGVNTTALAFDSGKPQVCVTFANDQLDNGRRVEALGAGHWIKERSLTENRLLGALNQPTTARAPFDDGGFGRRLNAAVEAILQRAESRA